MEKRGKNARGKMDDQGKEKEILLRDFGGKRRGEGGFERAGAGTSCERGVGSETLPERTEEISERM